MFTKNFKIKILMLILAKTVKAKFENIGNYIQRFKQ